MKGVEFVESEGRKVAVYWLRTPRGIWVAWPEGSRFVADTLGQDGAAVAAGEVVAPMTGKVSQVEVEVGQAVEKGELLLVLEAMKMEYRLTAPRAGVVETIACAPGEQVELGQSVLRLSEVQVE